LIIAGDCKTICDVLLDVIPMLEEASTIANSSLFIHIVLSIKKIKAKMPVIFENM